MDSKLQSKAGVFFHRNGPGAAILAERMVLASIITLTPPGPFFTPATGTPKTLPDWSGGIPSLPIPFCVCFSPRIRALWMSVNS